MPPDPKLVGDAIKEELMFMRKRRVHHEVPVSYLDKSGLKAIGTRWVHTNKCDTANPCIRAWLVAQETKRVSELTPEDASSTIAAALPLESLKVILSRCMIGERRTLAGEKVLGFYDIFKAHFHSPARHVVRSWSRCQERTTSVRVVTQFWTRQCTERRTQCLMMRVRMP